MAATVIGASLPLECSSKLLCDAVAGVGVCVAGLNTPSFTLNTSTALPVPVAFLPLGRSYGSYPLPSTYANPRNSLFINDATFGSVLSCNVSASLLVRYMTAAVHRYTALPLEGWLDAASLLPYLKMVIDACQLSSIMLFLSIGTYSWH